MTAEVKQPNEARLTIFRRCAGGRAVSERTVVDRSRARLRRSW